MIHLYFLHFSILLFILRLAGGIYRYFLSYKSRLMNNDIIILCNSMDIDPSNVKFILHGNSPISVGDLTCYSPTICIQFLNENKFILAHELSHIKLCHYTKASLIIISIVSFIPLIFDSLIKLYFISLLISIPLTIYVIRIFEKEADINACKYCTKNEIIQGISYLNTMKNKTDIGLVSTLIYLFDTHPDTDTRIRYLKQEILKKERNIKTD